MADNSRECENTKNQDLENAQDTQPEAELTAAAETDADEDLAFGEEENPLTEEDEKKKKRNKRLAIGIGAALAAVISTVFFVFILPLISHNWSPSLIIYSEGGNSYYASPYLVKLNDAKEPEIVTHQNDGMDKDSVILTSRSAKSGKFIYQCETGVPDAESFVKIEITSATTICESRWVSPQVVGNSPFSKTPGDAEWTKAVHHIQTDGKYIYFTLRPDAEHAASQADIRGKIGRIPLDGSTVEWIEDINAYDFVLDGDWIYYFDDGYVYDDSVAKRYASVAGIYKIKTDGTEKDLLYTFILTPQQEERYLDDTSIILCDSMQYIKNMICFLDYSSLGRGRICRIDRNGQNEEYLSVSAVRYYSLDTKHNVVYYETAAFDETTGLRAEGAASPELVKYDIRADEETAMDFVDCSCYAVSYYKDWLYFTSDSFSYKDGAKCGLRLNVATGEAQWMIFHDDGEQSLSWEKIQTD